MLERVKKVALALVLSAALGFGAGTMFAPAPLAAGDCMPNQKCKVNPEGDECVSGGTGCRMGIEICRGCDPTQQ